MIPQEGLTIGGRYLLTRRIAVGGMGEVWQARDEVLERDVAVKVLKPEYSSDDTFLARFRGEARHAAALSHPNIAGVYDYADTGDLAYLVMELVPGEPLNLILSRTGSLPTREVMVILAATARGLGAAHAAGVVHRDVKPGNILITPQGDVKITDFGIARAGDSVPLTQTGQVMGTAQYLAPEQASGQTVSGASDLYALGVVGYEALMGKRPFDGETPMAIAMAHVNTPAPPLPDSFSPGTRALIASALHKDPAMRPADAAGFAEIADLVSQGRDAEAISLLPTSEATTTVLGNDHMATSPLGAAMPGSPTLVQSVPTGGTGEQYYTPNPPSQQWDQPHTAGYAQTPEQQRNTGLIIGIISLLVIAGVIVGFLMFILNRSNNGANTPSTTDTNSVTTTAALPTTTTEIPTDTETDSGTETSGSVFINPDDFVGKDKDETEAFLRSQGLQVRLIGEKSSTVDSGLVTRLGSSGDFKPGETIRVFYSTGAPPASTTTSRTTTSSSTTTTTTTTTTTPPTTTPPTTTATTTATATPTTPTATPTGE